MVINRFSRQKILVSLEVIEFIEREAYLSRKTETGGVIGGIGRVEDKNVFITKVSNGGPNAIKKPFFFSRDTKYCQEIVNEWARNSNGEVDYLGEWHKHLEREPKPSSIDIETMKKISQSSDYHISQPILMIIGESNNRKSLRLYIINDKNEFKLASWKLKS
ncbi:MAG: Mov34/MPN/PAD-1 family protein [Anaerolineales bacterium]|nr:Mov34/MPN/PAD-1 family protein [Anaerolineales bacterium]